MNDLIKTASLSLLLAAALCAEASAQPAARENFNAEWKFIKADCEEFAEAGYDDSAWRTLDLPHDWGVEGPFEQIYPGETGRSWFP